MLTQRCSRHSQRLSRSGIPAASIASVILASSAAAQWSAEQADGEIIIRDGGAPQMTWRAEPLNPDVGGAAFRPSAFLHPLRTPAGFEWTTAQPRDHIHHLGLWWPWKHVVIDGTTYNCWELQHGHGAHVAVAAKPGASTPDTLNWTFQNEIRVRNPDEEKGTPALNGRTVIDETVHFRASRHGDDATVIDLAIHQRARGAPVRIGQYRYSGFAWRGPEAWTAANSEMITSEGLGRERANGTPGRWILVTGPTPADGIASVLLMSAAIDIAGVPERFRVWDKSAHGGTPFINFNPVQTADLPLDDAHPAVSRRIYRVIAADRKLDAAEAEAEWKTWREAAKQPDR